MTTSVVISSILLSGNDLLRMIKLAVSSRSHFVTNSRLKIDVNGAGYVLTSSSLTEESVEGIISSGRQSNL